MPYAPTVNDRSGEILGEYTANAANIRAQGMQSFGKSIGEGLAGLGGGIGGMLKESRENTAKLEGLAATGSAMQAILPQYGEEGIALANALNEELGKAGKNANKMAGTYMAFMPAVENLQTRYNQNAQYTQALILAQQKAALGLGGGGGSSPMLSVEVDPAVDISQ
jgi:hypothetical protein